MSILLELNPEQQVLLTDLMTEADRTGQIPARRGMAWSGILQQLAQPQETAQAVARIKAQAMKEAQATTPVEPTTQPS